MQFAGMSHNFTRILATGLLCLVASFGFWSAGVHAQVSPNNIVNYEGRILNANGVPVSDSSMDMEFRLYDELTGGSCLWSNDDSACATTDTISITLTNGLFSENLGATGDGYASIPDSVFLNDSSVYLEVDIDGETLSPRKLITAAPYALNAQALDGISSAGFLASDGDTGTGDYDFTGAVFSGESPFVFEGTTADAFETTFAFTDPTADNTITFQNSSGTVAFRGDLLWEDGTNGVYENDKGVIIGADEAFTTASGGIGDLRVADELEVAGQAYFADQVDVSGTLNATSGLDVTGSDFTVGGSNFVVTVGSGAFSAAAGGFDVDASGNITDVSSITSDGAVTIVNPSSSTSFGVTNNSADTLGASGGEGVGSFGSSSLTTGHLLNLELDESTLSGGSYLDAYDSNAATTVFSILESGALLAAEGNFDLDTSGNITDVSSITSDGAVTIVNPSSSTSFGVTNNTADTLGASGGEGVGSFGSSSLTTGHLLNLELDESTLSGGSYLDAYDADSATTVFSLLESGALLAAEGNFDLDSSGNITDVSSITSDGAFSTTYGTNAASSLEVINNTATTFGALGTDGVVQLSSTSLTTGGLLALHLDESNLTTGSYIGAYDTDGGTSVFAILESGAIYAAEGNFQVDASGGISGSTLALSGALNMAANLSIVKDDPMLFLNAEGGDIDFYVAIDDDDDDTSAGDTFVIGPGSDPESNQYFTMDGTGNVAIGGDLTITGDDLVMGTNTDGFMLIADGNGFNPVAISGDLSVTNTGVTSISCTDCLNADEIEDIYVLNAGDVLSGDLDLDSNLLVNIGDSGTDFTGSGGLTLADALSVNGGGIDIADGDFDIVIDNTSGNNEIVSTGGNLELSGFGNVDISSQAGNINLGANAVATDVNIGTGAAARTVTIGNTTTTTSVDIDSGSGGINANGAFSVGADGDGDTVTFHSDTAGDNLVWSDTDAKLTITGTDLQNALEVTAGDVFFSGGTFSVVDDDNDAASVLVQNNTVTTYGSVGGVGVVNLNSNTLTSGHLLNLSLDQAELDGGSYIDAYDTDANATVFSLLEDGDIVTSGDIALNGGNLTSTASTVKLFETGAGTQIDFAQATPTLNIGNTGNNQTFNIGGVDFSSNDSINIATAFSGTDAIYIGNSGADVGIFADQWTITDAGVATFATLNLTGDLDMNNNVITDIGAAGTDFTGTGGLTLADALTVSAGGIDIDNTLGTAEITATSGELELVSTGGNVSLTPAQGGVIRFNLEDTDENHGNDPYVWISADDSSDNNQGEGVLHISHQNYDDPGEVTRPTTLIDFTHVATVDTVTYKGYAVDATIASDSTDDHYWAFSADITNNDTTAMSGGVGPIGLHINLSDNSTTNGDLRSGIQIENNDSNGTIHNGIQFLSPNGSITDAIDASADNITNAVHAGYNYYTYSTLRSYEPDDSRKRILWEDSSSNALMELEDFGTEGLLGINNLHSESESLTILGDSLVDADGTSSSGPGGTGSMTAMSAGDSLVSIGDDTLDFNGDNTADGEYLCTDSLATPKEVASDDNDDCSDGAGGTSLLGSTPANAIVKVTSAWAFDDVDADGFLDPGTDDLFIDARSNQQYDPSALTVSGIVKLRLGDESSTEAVCHSGDDERLVSVGLVDCGGSPVADYAEMYPVEEGITYGDIVIPGSEYVTTMDGDRMAKLTKSSEPYQGPVAGIVSYNYGDFTSAGYNIHDADNPMPVALVGRVPVNVTDENGPIEIGDYLTTSSTLGKAMKATEVGRVIGMALESFDGESGQVMVQVNNSWWAGAVLTNDGSSTIVSDNVVLDATGEATEEETSFASYGLALRGSAWNGSESEAVEMMLQTVVDDTDSYRLSIRDTSDAEVAFISNEGSLSLSGDLMIAGNIYPSDRGVTQTEKYIYYDGSDGPGGDFMRTNAAGWSTGSYDFAEMFPSDEDLEPGDIVVFAEENEHVKRSVRSYDTQIAGIVSTRPGFLAGENLPDSYPIALAGRVPTKVSLENGDIRIGDPLTSSSTPGVAMRATEPGHVVGYALEAYHGDGEASVIAYVNPSYFGGDAIVQLVSAPSVVPGLAQNLTGLNMSGNIYLSGNQIVGAGRLSGLGDTWSIESDGTMKTKAAVKAVINSYTNKQIEAAAVLSTEHLMTLSGTAELENGQAEIVYNEVSKHFTSVISAVAPVHVVVTPGGPVSLYVSEKDQNGFTVKQVGGDPMNVPFDWMVTAYRKDFEPEEDDNETTTEESEEVSEESDLSEEEMVDNESSDEVQNAVEDDPADAGEEESTNEVTSNEEVESDSADNADEPAPAESTADTTDQSASLDEGDESVEEPSDTTIEPTSLTPAEDDASLTDA